MKTANTICYLIIIAFIFIGCATTKKINSVSIGMTKQEVIGIMGNPYRTSAIDGTEYLIYSLSEVSPAMILLFGSGDTNYYNDYYVRLVNGKVDSYGEKGDFDSTKNPTVKIITEENVKKDLTIDTSNNNDMYQELMKLNQLKREGILSDDEFEKQKKKVLDKY